VIFTVPAEKRPATVENEPASADRFDTIAAMSRLSIELPDSAREELIQAGRETNRPPEQVAAELLNRLLLVRRFDRAAQDVSRALKPDAPKNEDEAFEQIS
jgi:hypothetical protein